MCVFSISLVIDYVCVSLSSFHFENEIDMSFICLFVCVFPFCARQIVVKDREKGEAELRAKKSLNCEKKKNYKFDIVAVSCAGISSEK